jgi:hypothetical protein
MQESAEGGAEIYVLNFSHPLTADHLAQLEALTGQAVERVVDVPVQIDHDGDLLAQVVKLADATGLSPVEWQTLPLVVNPPGYAAAASALVVEMHGRIGHFPTILRIVPVKQSTPRRFKVAGMINLDDIRDAARPGRFNVAP